MSRKRSDKPVRRHRWRKRILITLAAVVIGLGALIALAPTIASVLGPRPLSRIATGAVPGAIRIEKLSLSWLGPQELGPVHITDPEGEDCGSLELRAEIGLLALLAGERDLGDIVVSGEASLVRGADGQINIQRALQGPPDPQRQAAGPLTLPLELAAGLQLDDIAVTWRNERDGTAGAATIAGDATISVAAGAEFDFVVSDVSAAGAGASGHAQLRGTITGLADATGRLQPMAASVEASLEATSLPAALIDSIAGTDGTLSRALGSTVGALVSVSGGMAEASAHVEATATTGQVDLTARFDGETVALTAPGAIEADMPALLDAWPQLRQMLRAGGQVELLTAPIVTVALAQASAQLPSRGEPFDLRAIGLDATVRTSRMGVRLAALDAGGRPSTLDADPLNVRVLASPLGDGVHLEADASASIEGESAGALRLSLDASVLDADGQLLRFERPGDLGIRGELTLRGFETRIVEPYVERYGLRLVEDVGPAVDLVINAAPDEGATELVFSLKSEHISADGQGQFAGSLVTLEGDGLRIALEQPAALADRLGAAAGVKVQQAGRVDLRLKQGRVDLEALAAGDLRGTAVTAQLEIEPARAAITLAGDQTPVETQPISASITTEDLAEAVTLTLKAAARVDGHNGGQLDLTAAAHDLLDADGRPHRAVPQTLRVSGAWKEISTALAQRFVTAAGLELAEDVGPRIDLTFGTQPQDQALAITLEAQARNVSAAIPVRWDGRALRSADEPVRITLRDVGSTLARLLPPDAPVALQSGGVVRVELTELTAPIAGGFKPADLGAAAVVRVEDLPAVTPAGDALTLPHLAVRYAGADPEAPRLELDGQLRHGAASIPIAGGFDLQSPFGLSPGSWAGAIVALAPRGQLEIDGIPPALIESMIPAAQVAAAPDTASNGSTKPDISEIIEKLTGPGATVRVALAPAGDAVTATLNVEDGATTIAAATEIRPSAIRLASATVDTTLEPGLIEAFVPEQKARLAESSPLRISARPLDVPILPTGALDLASAELQLNAQTAGRLLIEQITLPSEGDEPGRTLPPLGLEGFSAELNTTGAALVASGEVALRVETEIITTGARRVAHAVAGASLQTSQGAVSGDPELSVVLRNLDAVFCDDLAGRELLVSGATGDEIEEVAIEAAVRRDPESSRPVDLQRLVLSVNAPRLRTTEPLRLDREGDSLMLQAPTEIHWTAVPGWTNPFVARVADDPAQTPGYRARFSAPTSIVLDLDEFAIGPPGAYMASDVFALHAIITSDRIAAMTAAGNDVSLSDVDLQVSRGDQPGSIAWVLRATQRGVEGGGNIETSGEITSLADERGAPALDGATITLHVDAPVIRSALLDSIMRQRGLIHALMGEQMALEADVNGLSTSGGTASVSAGSPLAQFALEGRVTEDGVFVVTGPERLVTLTQITSELSELLAPGLPQIARIEKRPEDGPAYVTHNNLQIPVNEDLTNLNGEVTITLGTARFQTSSAFAKVLKTVERKSEGTVGRRLAPLTLEMTNGVITYDRYTIPLGEFTMETSGNIDLPNERLEVITWIPIGALTDEAAGMFNTGLGSFLGRAVPEFERLTMVPWRTSGKFGNTTTLPAPALFVENVGSRLLRPDKMIRDIFGDYSKPKDQPQQSPPPADSGGEQTGGTGGG